MRASVQNGGILVNNTPFFTMVDEEGNTIKSTQAFSLEYGWQMIGGKEWHQACKYPRVGVGVQHLRVLRRNELGHPFSVYGFYDGNYYWSKNFQFTNRLAAGLAYGLRHYNPNDAMPNYVIGTRVNAFAEMGVGIALRMNDFIFIEPGFRFSHFSNGNIRKPQRGINITSFNIGLSAIISQPYKTPAKMPLGDCLHRHELLAYVGMAPRQMEFKNENIEKPHETFGLNFLMANLHLGYNYEVNRRLKLGGGIDLVYDGTNGQQEAAISGTLDKRDVPFRDKIGLSVFIGGESAVDKLSIITTLGYMVAQNRFDSSTPAFEQRLGFKYHFYKNVFAGVNIRAYNFKAAKAIEFNVGMRKYLGDAKNKTQNSINP